MKKKKILLLHGWDWKYYNNLNPGKPWSNRINFVNLLSNYFEVITIGFPGFFGFAEPKETYWTMDNYLEFLEAVVKKENPEFVLGYSFGASVLVSWKCKMKSNIPIILVSPAIARNYSVKSGNSLIKNIAKKIPLLNRFLKNFYLTYIVKNNFFTKGTPFLKKTYLSIVKENTSNYLNFISKKEFILIFGSNDTATPLSELSKFININEFIGNLQVIDGGGHDIANSHTVELVEQILNFTKKFN